MLISELRSILRKLGRQFVSYQDKSTNQPTTPDLDDDALGPLRLFNNTTWKNIGLTEGRGWNMIALPFDDAQFDYRLLVNQYEETLKFKFVDKGVPNRGIEKTVGTGSDADSSDTPDQFIVATDYEQFIKQLAAQDAFVNDLTGDINHNDEDIVFGKCAAIHHEPGLWLHMLDERSNDLDIARLGTIPHGNSVLALGKSKEFDGPAPDPIPDINGLPVGVPQDINNPYLAPYKFFNDNPFKGVINVPAFQGFNPVSPSKLLQEAREQIMQDWNIVKTILLPVDTKIETGGVVNIPFIEHQADAARMQSTFWIMNLENKADSSNTKWVLQYLQNVRLDFFTRRDGQGLIEWPHVSINTLELAADDDKLSCDD